MAFVRKYKKNGRVYLAEVESYRHDGKVKQKFIRHLGPDPATAETDFVVKSRELTVESVKIYGPVIALESIARDLGFYELLGELAAPVLTLAIGHCLDYKSIADAKTWFTKTELPVLLGCPEMSLDMLYSALEELSRIDEDWFQKSIFENLTRIFGEDKSGVIYDTTNTHLGGTRSDIAKKGKDKDGVKGRKLIQIGLGVTRTKGLPIFHHTREGNIHDSKMFREAIDHFKRININSGLIVFDRGITSKNSICLLSDLGWKILAGVPFHKGIKSIISKMDFSEQKSFRNLVVQGDTEFYVATVPYTMETVSGRLFILQNAAKKQRIESKRRKDIDAARKGFHDCGLDIPDELSKFFNKNGRVNWHAVKRAEEIDGLSFLFSNSRISRPEALNLYFAKDLIERCFKLEKSVLNLRPIRFWLDSKIKSHVLICHISLALLTTFQLRLKNHGITCDIAKSIRELNSVYRIGLNAKKGSKMQFSLVNTMTKTQHAILKAVAPNLGL